MKQINIEIFCIISGLLCIWLASKEKSINYFFGIINVSLCSYLFFQNQLYGSLMLQIFFLITNIYGWYNWNNNSNNSKIRYLSSYKTIIIFLIISIFFIITFYIYINTIFDFLTKITIIIMKYFGLKIVYTNIKPNSLPFWDSCILVLSIIAMILMTHKYIENWLIWIIINLISVKIFLFQKMYIMAIEYLLLTCLSLYGYFLWSAKIKLS